MSLINDFLQRATRNSGSRIVAIRGAIDVAADTPADIRSAVTQLVREIDLRNEIEQQDIVSAMFTMTGDLVSTFPAEAARASGWSDVPMLCATEIAVPNALGRCLRVLVHAYLPTAKKVEHVYLGTAVRLRPDLHVAKPDSRR
jgi:chorismate mutase